MGLISPCGIDPDSFWASLMSGRSGVRPLPARFAQFMQVDIAAQCPESLRPWLDGPQIATLDRVSQLARVAAAAACADAQLRDGDTRSDRVGVFLGTGAGGAGSIDESLERMYLRPAERARPLSVVMGMNHAPAAQVAMAHGVRGPCFTYSTACSSAPIAIGEAYRRVQSGEIDVAIAGGSEAPLTPGMIRAWEALGALAKTDAVSPAESCRPFDLRRNGFVMGEGAAFLVLESAQAAERRGVEAHAELIGYATTNDAFHIAKPSVAGEVVAIKLALEAAHLNVRDVGYINAHATGTILGDQAEAEAIQRVFGDFARHVPVSSTKALHGHLIGASGALEAIACILAIKHAVIPPTAHLDQPDPAFALDLVAKVPRPAGHLRVALSNSFAFGGCNVVLAFRRAPRCSYGGSDVC